MNPKGHLNGGRELRFVETIEELALVAPLRLVCKLSVAFDTSVATCTFEPDKATVSWSLIVSSELGAEFLKASAAVAVEGADL